jgi:hypothetical protein
MQRYGEYNKGEHIMTLLIGANLKHYTIVAADTRTSWSQLPFGRMYRDGDHKIIMCDLGLITGSGYTDALELVKKELLTKVIFHTDEFIEIINQRALPKINELHRTNPQARDNTCFLVSYRTVLNNENMLRLALFHPKWNYQLGYYEDVTVVMPADSKEEEVEKYSLFLREHLVKFNDKGLSDDEYVENLFTGILDNIKIIAKCFCEISQQSFFVSQDMDFAALLLNGTVIYGYGESNKLVNGNFKMSIIPSSHQSHILTPDIFKEGEQIK